MTLNFRLLPDFPRGRIEVCATPGFMWCWGQKLELLVSWASTLPTEPHHQLTDIHFNRIFLVVVLSIDSKGVVKVNLAGLCDQMTF